MNFFVIDKQFRQKRTELGGRAELLTAYFLDIQKKFKPVMRHYFTERHKMPISWFAMRLHYARSVATTSIVGHVTGLGDRHPANILMDNITGEVIHIDLGIAFDQVRSCYHIFARNLILYRENFSGYQNVYLSV
jgi:serine-protein kinase ATM